MESVQRFRTFRWFMFWIGCLADVVRWRVRSHVAAATCLVRTEPRCEATHGECRCTLDENHSGTFHVCSCEHHWRDLPPDRCGFRYGPLVCWRERGHEGFHRTDTSINYDEPPFDEVLEHYGEAPDPLEPCALCGAPLGIYPGDHECPKLRELAGDVPSGVVESATDVAASAQSVVVEPPKR